MGRTHISVQEAAQMSGLCDETIRRYIYSGRIKNAIKLPKAWRIPIDWLEQIKEVDNANLQDESTEYLPN